MPLTLPRHAFRGTRAPSRNFTPLKFIAKFVAPASSRAEAGCEVEGTFAASMAARACECDAAQHRQQLIEMITLLLVPIDHLEALVAFEERRQLESPNPMLLGVRLCRQQAGFPEAPYSTMYAQGCPRLRPVSSNQPRGRRWPATQALWHWQPCSLAFDTGVSKALLQMESVLLSHGISKLAPKGCGPFVAREHAVVSTSASGCVDACVPGRPYCTYGLRVPASCVLCVPGAQGNLLQWPRRCTRINQHAGGKCTCGCACTCTCTCACTCTCTCPCACACYM